ncbi:hypothetical protein MPH_04678 [Macrophomina phaseolina MS6]|uniref:Uncharacterized protein n=1 Tax=Macrophomina phaseolina (strain MS6) TaxID=1126212 RepID=K2S638_MACPH|nr:hypothetical protein MPH_04678 [Macrophomina phaseolina MS6]
MPVYIPPLSMVSLETPQKKTTPVRGWPDERRLSKSLYSNFFWENFRNFLTIFSIFVVLAGLLRHYDSAGLDAIPSGFLREVANLIRICRLSFRPRTGANSQGPSIFPSHSPSSSPKTSAPSPSGTLKKGKKSASWTTSGAARPSLARS